MKNKYALITGGGKRIGSSICKYLAAQGWQVIIHYNNSKFEAEKTLKEIETNNGKAFLIKADLSSTNQIRKLIPRINKKYGQLSMLINNASIFVSKKHFIASSGVSTIGSSAILKLVFNKTGTPVFLPNSLINS